MNKRQILNSAVLIVMAGLLGCAGQQETLPPPSPADTEAADSAQMVTVQVAVENLREIPNGRRVGETTGGSEHEFLQRRGNWVQVRDMTGGGVWIWAPSVGFAKINPISVPLWLGVGKAQNVDTLTSIFGAPEQIELVGGDVFRYRYLNQKSNQSATLFGTQGFREVEALIDRESREVLRVDFTLSPFVGSAKDLLSGIGLPDVRSTKTNFDHALYVKKFNGISQVEFIFAEGDFNSIVSYSAVRYPMMEYQTALTYGEKKIVHEDGSLILSMEVSNSSGNYSFAALEVSVELVVGSNPLGNWTLGPLDVRIEPGEHELIYEPLPISDDGLDVNTIAARAEIIRAVTVPASPVSKP